MLVHWRKLHFHSIDSPTRICFQTCSVKKTLPLWTLKSSRSVQPTKRWRRRLGAWGWRWQTWSPRWIPTRRRSAPWRRGRPASTNTWPSCRPSWSHVSERFPSQTATQRTWPGTTWWALSARFSGCMAGAAVAQRRLRPSSAPSNRRWLKSKSTDVAC